MYNGQDRVKQMNALRQIADDLFEGYNVQCPTDARFTADDWRDRHQMPDWYGDHEHQLLVELIATEALEDMLYRQPTGHTELVEFDDTEGVEVVVLTPEREVAYRLNNISVDGPWEMGAVRDAAGFIVDQQRWGAEGSETS